MRKLTQKEYISKVFKEDIGLIMVDPVPSMILTVLNKYKLGLSDYEDAVKILAKRDEEIELDNTGKFRYLMGILHTKGREALIERKIP